MIGQALSDIDAIDAAYVYGSRAARFSGEVEVLSGVMRPAEMLKVWLGKARDLQRLGGHAVRVVGNSERALDVVDGQPARPESVQNSGDDHNGERAPKERVGVSAVLGVCVGDRGDPRLLVVRRKGRL